MQISNKNEVVSLLELGNFVSRFTSLRFLSLKYSFKNCLVQFLYFNLDSIYFYVIFNHSLLDEYNRFS